MIEKLDTGRLVFHIQIFGLNEKGETCSLYIRDYKPFIYIKIGENYDKNNKEILQNHYPHLMMNQ